LRIKILSIGNELLEGRTINTNAAVISKGLADIGIATQSVVTIPDSAEEIVQALDQMLPDCDLIIATGGLGPTPDDRTKGILSNYFGQKLIKDESVYRDLKRRYGDGGSRLEEQAMIPEGAKALINPVGTAPGLWFDKLIALPGVPLEMSALLNQYVFPELKKRGTLKPVCEVRIMLERESHIAGLIEEFEQTYPDATFGSYPEFGCVAIRFRGGETDKIKHAIFARYPQRAFIAPSVVHALMESLTEEKSLLVCTESCTGGAIASHLTQVSGASDFLVGSYVTYSNEMKQRALGVKLETLKEHGAVSAEVVTEMVDGALENTDAKYALATSGVAGPTGALPNKPVGTVWAAIKERGGPTMLGLIPCSHKESREGIISFSTAYMIGALWLYVAHKEVLLK